MSSSVVKDRKPGHLTPLLRIEALPRPRRWRHLGSDLAGIIALAMGVLVTLAALGHCG